MHVVVQLTVFERQYCSSTFDLTIPVTSHDKGEPVIKSCTATPELVYSEPLTPLLYVWCITVTRCLTVVNNPGIPGTIL